MIEENTTYLIEKHVITAGAKPKRLYWIMLFISIFLFILGALCWAYQIKTGMGVTGKNHPVSWYIYITDFVFWVGIAHSGTLISAVLYLFRAKFRKSFNRSAEAMTVFALATAALFPLIHLGRVWVFYWLIPYPNQRELVVNFNSPLIWDVFAVGTYFTVSLVFFYVGLIPDLAITRRYVSGIKEWIFRFLSLGWRGTYNEWRHYNVLYLFLASFATPLVVSVHSVVSWDFAMSILPGWHTTIFAPYFVSGAIFSGTAMVITLVVPMRKYLALEKYITEDHFESIAKILLITSLIVTYSYIVEFGLAFYGENIFDKELFKYRAFGDLKILFFIMITCNSIIPLTLFVKCLRRNIAYLFVIAIFVNIGMWLERFVIIVSSLSHDFDPYAWGLPNFSLVALGITLGSFGLFFMLFLIFIKILPVLSISELKE
jgi:molybdopterin-containing oxidoreductase family membrane subunit